MQIVGGHDGKRAVSPSDGPRLDRAKWHRPLISIIVTHYNYSSHIEDALLSILDQTHENWECVVVDDCSAHEQRETVEAIVNSIGSEKIRLLALPDNVGQTHAFFAGLDATGGEFVCLLDPDDRYAETFLEEMLKTHLNETVFCPMACCDQHLFKNGAVLSGVNTLLKMPFLEKRDDITKVPEAAVERILYYPATNPRWFATSSSSLMFRRAALNLLRPHKTLPYKTSADAYMVLGAHRLGGTLFLTKPLVYRGIHNTNAYITTEIFASTQDMRGHQGHQREPEYLNDALEAIRHNGGGAHLDKVAVQKPKMTPFKRWRRSLRKRWRNITGKGKV